MQKTLKIYSNMSDADKKQWYTVSQLVRGFMMSIKSEEDLRGLDEDDRVRSKHFVVQSDDHMHHLKHGEGKFLGVKWAVEKMYNYEDFSKVKDEYVNHDEDDMMRRVKLDRTSRIEDFRSYLNDVRSLKYSDKVEPVVFYGDKKDALVHNSMSDSLRNYYGLFLNYDYMKRWFSEVYSIRENVLDALLFLHVYKFFIFTDFLNFYKVNLSFTTGKKRSTTSARKFFEFLLDEGFIEKVKYENNDLNRFKNYTMHKTTDKADKLVYLFMDLVTYRKKMDFSGSALNLDGVTIHDLYDKEIFNTRWKSSRHYIFYEWCYEYVNYKADVEFFDGDLKEFERKLSGDDFCFNPMIYKIAELKVLESNGKKTNNTYIQRFLNSPRFGRKL